MRSRGTARSKLESRIVHDIRIQLSELDGVVFWRNSRGVHRDGERVVATYGLADGASDLVGIVDGRFTALEVKRPKEHPTEAQELFLVCVRRAGGFGAVVRSVEEAINAVKRCRAGKSQ